MAYRSYRTVSFVLKYSLAAVIACAVFLALIPLNSPPPVTARQAAATPTALPAPRWGPEIIHFRADTGRSGVFDTPAIQDQPVIQWRSELGDFFLGTPLVVDGVLYTGGSNGSVYAIDAANGSVLWSVGGFEAVETALAVAGDVLIVGGFSSTVQALDRRDGTVIWSVDTSTFVFAAPLIKDNQVYIATYDSLLALDLETGSLEWESDTGDEMGFASSPALADDTLYVTTPAGLLAFDRTTGQERWRIPAETQFWGLAVTEDLVVAGSSAGFLFAYDQQSGKQQWAFKANHLGEDNIWSAPAVDGDRLYVGNSDRFVYALETSSGQPVWTFETAGTAVSDPVVSDGVVYVSDSNHALPDGPRHLYALDAHTGEKLWTFELNSTLLTTPALGDHGLYITTITGEILALE
ncbi:MAG: PQQ-binding-like beta-propeller repeat protein [Chloroflexi bacterium]|nr:PQQ-binding-like beta-propeller repeat protein [Chloroflexota bacterium]